MAYSDVQHPHDYPLAVDADASEPLIHHVKCSNLTMLVRNSDAYGQRLVSLICTYFITFGTYVCST